MGVIPPTGIPGLSIDSPRPGGAGGGGSGGFDVGWGSSQAADREGSSGSSGFREEESSRSVSSLLDSREGPRGGRRGAPGGA